ncbi:MAG TPA: hypothetical protein VMA86_00235 [Acetobacteraceae bacterium]|nr:hypothetical protein [Acetobacteraceae bacterium]
MQSQFLIWRELEVGRLEAVMTDWSPPPIALTIVAPPGRLRPARVSAVIDFLAEHLAAAPWALAAAITGARPP